MPIMLSVLPTMLGASVSSTRSLAFVALVSSLLTPISPALPAKSAPFETKS